ncbi:MAG: hypothetical protein KTR25_05960 [Myxococcales bacterium]|nr:hypothetical protein [Myxococcales bacterium]
MVVKTDHDDLGQLRWSQLRQGDEHALQQAEVEVWEIARALAIESLASDVDAELMELGGRQKHLIRAAWPDKPLEGFHMQSSLGAFVVARVAIAWVPAGQTGLRYAALSPEGIIRALMNQGVDELTAKSVLGGWTGISDGFEGDEEGLDAGTLAGLAERSLTSAERDTALAQIAFSPRDLARLGAALTLSRRVRQLLPVVIPRQFGEDITACLALVATQRPERAMALLSSQERSEAQQAVYELAHTLARFIDGADAELEEDRRLPVVPEAADQQSVTLPAADSSSDLEAYSPPDNEGSMPEEDQEEPLATSPSARPELPKWWLTESDDYTLIWDALTKLRAQVPQRQAILGFTAVPRYPREQLIPPVPGVYTPAMNPAEPFVPVVRIMLRAVVSATKGLVIDETGAGGCDWVLRRVAALSRLIRGELDLGLSVLQDVGAQEAPELRWLRDRKIRFDGRKAEPLSPEAARRAAATLVLDLARALARTLTGAVPDVDPSVSDDR